jgi:heme-degrading monooxygenase HmoA
VARAFTHTVWLTKPGCEEEFVRRWIEWARWSASQGVEGHGTLLRDADDPRRFVSFAPWVSFEAATRWRTLQGFNERIARLQELVESFQPATLEQVAEA